MLVLNSSISHYYYVEILMSGKVEMDKGFYLPESKLAWILFKRTNAKQEPNYAMTVFTQATSRIQNQINNNLTMETALPSDLLIEDLCRLKTIEISDNLKQSDDKRAFQHFTETVKKERGRQNVNWPWRKKNPNLTDKYGLAL